MRIINIFVKYYIISDWTFLLLKEKLKSFIFLIITSLIEDL